MVTFVVAILLAKGVITAKEAKELSDMATFNPLNSSLPQMTARVQEALNKAHKKPVADIDTVDAKEVFGKGLAEQK